MGYGFGRLAWVSRLPGHAGFFAKARFGGLLLRALDESSRGRPLPTLAVEKASLYLGEHREE